MTESHAASVAAPAAAPSPSPAPDQDPRPPTTTTTRPVSGSESVSTSTTTTSVPSLTSSVVSVADLPTSPHPTSTPPTTAPATTTAPSSSGLPASFRPPSTRAASLPPSGPPSLTVSQAPSLTASPRSSRDSSPAGGRPSRIRTAATPANAPLPTPQGPGPASSTASGTARGMRSRKNSHDVSPQRPPAAGPANVPSAAAIQRALSAAAVPTLLPQAAAIQETLSKLPRATKSADAPSWPISPRLKSPPPSSSRRNSLRAGTRGRGEPAAQAPPQAPSIVLQRTATPDNTGNGSGPDNMEKEEASAFAPPRGLGRGASGGTPLETVQEASNPTTPGSSLPSQTESKYFGILSDEDRPASGQVTPRRAKHLLAGADSGSDSGGMKREAKREASADAHDPDATPRPKMVNKASFSSLRPKDPHAMTVETETVNSVAQPTLGPDGGTLRVKASSETIRPGKSRRRAARKAPSLNSNTVSTRADIFEDRVKNAMDAASSDDSDETFVYESNPPEPQPQPRRSRHHSRTPSGASLASMAEQQRAAGPPTALRSIGTTLEAPRAMPKSRSMKFANAYSSGADEESIDRGGDGTIRASAQRGTAHHHHLGRPARGGHPSILDDDGGPFLQPKTRSLTGMSRANGRGTSNGNGFRGNANGLGRKDVGYQSYDLDADGGDDERTPLMNTIRGPRGRRNLVRVNRHGDYQTLPSYLPPRRNGDTRGRSCMSRFAGCVVLFVMLMLLTFGAVGFLFAISTPLAEVEIVGIENVLASEQELMVDLVVRAVNPNLLPITVADMDINIFAKSKFVGSEKWWRDHGKLPPLEEGAALATVATRRMKEHKDRVRATQAPQQPTVNASGLFWPDPDPDPSGGDPDDDDPSPNRQTMLLGRIARFDSPLTFEGSFLRRRVARSSTGSLRLSKPGNRTEAGGTERWERVLRHSFELIVRGTLRYRIPLGGRAHAVPVARSVIVHPESEEVDEPVDGEIKISKKEVVRDMGKRVKMMFWG